MAVFAFVATAVGAGGCGEEPTGQFQITFLAVPDDCFGGDRFEVRFEGSDQTVSTATTPCVQGDGALFSGALSLDTYIVTAIVVTSSGAEVCRASPRTRALDTGGQIVEDDITSWPISCY
jgi:hypothetical protein